MLARTPRRKHERHDSRIQIRSSSHDQSVELRVLGNAACRRAGFPVVPVNGDETLNGHYRWDSRKRWKPDRIELVLIVAATALIIAVLALTLSIR